MLNHAAKILILIYSLRNRGIFIFKIWGSDSCCQNLDFPNHDFGFVYSLRSRCKAPIMCIAAEGHFGGNPPVDRKTMTTDYLPCRYSFHYSAWESWSCNKPFQLFRCHDTQVQGFQSRLRGKITLRGKVSGESILNKGYPLA